MFNEEGSQSKPALLAATLFMALLGAGCLYLVFTGPNPTSPLILLRSGWIFYPVMLLGSGMFPYMAWLGIKRFRSL